jgi:membrane-associated phospholipid phosphatase
VVSQRAVALTKGRLRPVDRLLLGYLAFVSFIALTRPEARERGWVLVANGLIAVLIFLLSRDRLGRFARLREVYPILLLMPLYGSLDLLSGAGSVAVHDVRVQGWETALFGGQPSRDWWRAAPSRFWSTVLHGAYFTYYGILLVPAIVLLARGRLAELRGLMFALMATFVFCYIWFILFPVAGPYYEFPRPTGEFVDNPMARLVYATLATGSSYGAAFPSSHVAASVATTIVSARASPALGLGVAVPTLLLTIGVVYCQMHYAVDAIAGLVIGATIALAVAKSPNAG